MNFHEWILLRICKILSVSSSDEKKIVEKIIQEEVADYGNSKITVD